MRASAATWTFREISIHFPRVGDDGKDDTWQFTMIISIHVPRVGDDLPR